MYIKNGLSCLRP